ncbi:hypothetical protein LZ554_001050 [Drepanopeziza brunnea f. sp. 'monogermtubi']|nr:hypothetical protein LZ554_001050 [Drepanopeziza brunnea f. sp. 'monogermtubi']
MSDGLRKDFSTQASEKITPDSSKTTTDKIGENITGAADKAAAAVQPSGEKSTTQKAGDTVRGEGDNAQKEGESIVDKVTGTVTDTINSLTGKTDEAAKKNDLK